MIRNDNIIKGVAIGLGVALVAPVVIAALAPVVKPIARSALKAGSEACASISPGFKPCFPMWRYTFLASAAERSSAWC
mgnify:CR=1 FL=1